VNSEEWELTDHAVERYIQRVEPRLTVTEARLKLAELTARLRYVKTYDKQPEALSEKYRHGYELWRGPKPRRLRCWAARGDDGMLQLVTVMTGKGP
jgi:hypothetical protein